MRIGRANLNLRKEKDFLNRKKKLNKSIEKWIRQQFLKCVLVTPGVPKILSGVHDYFYNNTQMSFAFSTMLTFALMMQKPWWPLA